MSYHGYLIEISSLHFSGGLFMSEMLISEKKKFAKQWNVMMMLGFLFGYSLPMLLILLLERSNFLSNSVVLVVFVLPIIGLQSFALNKWTDFNLYWLISGISGIVLGLIVMLATKSSIRNEELFPIYGLIIAIIGFTIVQWVILRRYVSMSIFWITTNAFAWIVAMIILLAILSIFIFSHYCWYGDGELNRYICTLLPMIISGPISGFVYGSITARYFFERLFKPNQ
jgi:hypothetical protein